MSWEEDDAVALVRVYCGLASADSSARRAAEGQTLMVAVVDDAGRRLHVSEISDDAAGYARLSSLLAERASGSPSVSVAADSDDLLVTSLLTAAGRPLAVADDDDADDFAERFADDQSIEEMQSSPESRRAVGLARALQAGALTAITVAPPASLMGYQPVLNAHAALSTGRHAAAVALREVLRELYPAALRAYPDPAEPLALAVLAAVPEPSRLGGGTPGRGREITVATDAIASQIVSDGVASADEVQAAITALQVSVNEAARRGVNRALAPTVAETVRHAVAAVRACDLACETLVSTLASRIVTPAPVNGRMLGAPAEQAPAPAAPVAAPVPIHPTRGGGAAAAMGSRRARIAASEAAQPFAAPQQPQQPQRMPLAPAASADPHGPDTSLSPLSRPDTSSIQLDSTTGAYRRVDPGVTRWAAREGTGENTPVSPAARRPDSLANRPVSAPPPPPPGLTPIQPGVRPGPKPPTRTPSPADSGEPFRAPLTTAAINNGRAEHRQRISQLTSRDDEQPVNGTLHTPPPTGGGLTDIRLGMPPSRTSPQMPQMPQMPEPGSRAAWPTSPEAADERAHTGEQAQLRGPARPDAPTMSETLRVRPPWQSDDLPPEPPVLRLVEGSPRTDRGDSSYTPPLRLVDTARRASQGPDALDMTTPLPVSEGDNDLLIFSAAASAWFTGRDEDAEATPDLEWASLADQGWQAAEQAARPAVGAETGAGLPKRVPQANLVPGSALREERPLRVVRDAQSLAANTTGYFRGWRRGQEIGGFAVGGRPGREAAGGWDFTRDQGDTHDDEEDYEFRPATYRS
ncbi:transposase [Catenuloplanes sp. NPDC051500]|uniref:transposase n=1 Tax=Catenuloplanes sp. NPDC051500 TaxID=3363959 RepID=UPI0037A53A97